MVHRDDLGGALPDPVDDSIGAADQFSQGRVSELRYNATGLGKVFQLINRHYETCDERPGISG
jgi:hypothetical protein